MPLHRLTYLPKVSAPAAHGYGRQLLPVQNQGSDRSQSRVLSSWHLFADLVLRPCGRFRDKESFYGHPVISEQSIDVIQNFAIAVKLSDS